MSAKKTSTPIGPGRTLFLDIGILGASNAFGKLLWATSLMLMMRALGPADYGRLVVIWSTAGMIAPLTDLGLSQLLLREGSRQPALTEQLRRLALLMRLAVGLPVVAAIVIFSNQGVHFSHLSLVTVAIATAAPLVDGAFLTATASAQIEGKIKSLALWRLAGFAALAMLLLLLLPYYNGMTVSATAYLGASMAALLGFFLSARSEIRPESSPPISTRAALRRARPFLFMGVAAVAYGKLDVALIGVAIDSTSAAYYHASYQIILLVFSIPEVIFVAMFAGLYRSRAEAALLAQQWPSIRKVLCAVTAVILPSLWLYSPEVMKLLGGESFQPAGNVLRALCFMIALIPAAASFNFLLLLDRPHERAIIDSTCVAATALVIVIIAPRLSVTWAALMASAIYAFGCGVSWSRVKAAGLKLGWGADMFRAILLSTPSALLWLLPWPAWWMGASSQALASGCILYFSGFVRISDLRVATH